jgi:hypothetical protein
MARVLRTILIAVAVLVALIVAAGAAAWLLFPKDKLDREAQRQASRLSGTTIRWARLSPGFHGFSIGIRIEGLYAKLPAQGPPRVEAAPKEVFLSFRLLPLLSRRLEISAARVTGGGIALTDRGAPGSPGSMPSASTGAAMAMVLPRVDLVGVDVRTRDRLGGGLDVRQLTATTQIEGTVLTPRAIRIDARADSLLWKPSGHDPMVALPGPVKLSARTESKDGGKRLVISQGEASLGPLVSRIGGEIRMENPREQPQLDLVITGGPLDLRSSDPAFRALASRSPASWTTKASWEIHVGGTAAAPDQAGRVTLKPLSVTASNNTFALDQLDAKWATAADQTFTASANGGGSGLTLSLEARGSAAPGGRSSGELVVQGPAARLNGLVPDTPTWSSGDVEVRARFELEPPAAPMVKWTLIGKGMSGTVPGVAQPVRKLDFNLDGDENVVNIRSFGISVGSTNAKLTGTVTQGKPLGTGSFRLAMDRLVAEEWAPKPGTAPSGVPGAAPGAPAPPPVPLRAFDATVSIGELRSGGLTLSSVTVPVTFANGTLSADPIRGAIGTGSLSGSMRVEDLVGTPSYAMHMDVKRAPVQDLSAGLLPVKLDLTGFASGVIDLAGPGMPGGAATDSLRGALTGTIEDGKIGDTPTIQGIRNALGIASGTTGDLAFKTLTQSIRIDRGRLLLEKIKGDVGKDLFEMNGWLGLDQKLDVNLLLRLDPSRIQGGTALATVARYARDADGRFPLNLKITGTTAAPKVTIEPNQALQAAGGRVTEQLMKSLTRSTPRDSASKDSAATDPTLDALKRLFGK